jgi:hypothetical protein
MGTAMRCFISTRNPHRQKGCGKNRGMAAKIQREQPLTRSQRTSSQATADVSRKGTCSVRGMCEPPHEPARGAGWFEGLQARDIQLEISRVRAANDDKALQGDRNC